MTYRSCLESETFCETVILWRVSVRAVSKAIRNLSHCLHAFSCSQVVCISEILTPLSVDMKLILAIAKVILSRKIQYHLILKRNNTSMALQVTTKDMQVEAISGLYASTEYICGRSSHVFSHWVVYEDGMHLKLRSLQGYSMYRGLSDNPVIKWF